MANIFVSTHDAVLNVQDEESEASNSSPLVDDVSARLLG
jgi:hypothetical protein